MLSQLLVKKLNDAKEVIEQSEITHLHFSGWPDLNTPKSESQLEGVEIVTEQLLAHYTKPN